MTHFLSMVLQGWLISIDYNQEKKTELLSFFRTDPETQLQVQLSWCWSHSQLNFWVSFNWTESNHPLWTLIPDLFYSHLIQLKFDLTYAPCVCPTFILARKHLQLGPFFQEQFCYSEWDLIRTRLLSAQYHPGKQDLFLNPNIGQSIHVSRELMVYKFCDKCGR